MYIYKTDLNGAIQVLHDHKTRGPEYSNRDNGLAWYKHSLDNEDERGEKICFHIFLYKSCACL